MLGKLAELADQGVEIHFFAGNHDLWVRDYFQKELGFIVHHQAQEFVINDKKFFIAHGDGLGPKDKGYKRMKKVFKAPFFQWLFRWVHPDIGMRLGQYLSVKNKTISGDEDVTFLGEKEEWLVQYCHRKLAEEKRDFFIFGHRHLPLDLPIGPEARYVNLGDWITHFTFAEFDGTQLELKKWDS